MLFRSKLLLPGLKSDVKKAWLLANSAALKTVATDEGVVVTLPAKALDPIATVAVLHIPGELKVEKNLLSQAADGSVVLSAIQANIHNFNGSDAQVEEKGGIPNIGFWTASGVTVDWGFKITKPGRFDIVASVACANEKSQFQILVDNQKLSLSVTSTGSYDTFADQKLGQVELKTAGEYLLQIKPDKNAWAPINIRSLTLKPAQ